MAGPRSNQMSPDPASQNCMQTTFQEGKTLKSTARMGDSRPGDKDGDEEKNVVFSFEVEELGEGEDLEEWELGFGYRHRPKTPREKCAQGCLSVLCTGTVGLLLSLCVVIAVTGVIKAVSAAVFWRRCPASPDLPVFQLVSGIVPMGLYVTCRTRRKYQGAVPGKQRLAGHWQFSHIHCTLDCPYAWQAGLASLLVIFLLLWLCYGTVLTLAAMQVARTRLAGHCLLASSSLQDSGQGNSSFIFTSSLSSAAAHSSSEGSSGHSGGQNSSRENLASRLHSRFGVVNGSLARGGVSANASITDTRRGSGVASQILPPVLNGTVNDYHISSRRNLTKSKNHTTGSSTSQAQYSNANRDNRQELPSIAREATNLTLPRDSVLKPSGDDSALSGAVVKSHDGNETSLSEVASLECLECDKTFLLMCFCLVMLDWAYVAGIVVKLLMVAIVPCCCLKHIQTVNV